jgi:hypothetical protein
MEVSLTFKLSILRRGNRHGGLNERQAICSQERPNKNQQKYDAPALRCLASKTSKYALYMI